MGSLGFIMLREIVLLSCLALGLCAKECWSKILKAYYSCSYFIVLEEAESYLAGLF